MNHEVVWSSDAYLKLQRIWEAAGDRELIAHAIDEIEEALSKDADRRGESRPDGSRVFFAAPLGVTFLANDRTTEVEIRAVWRFRSTF